MRGWTDKQVDNALGILLRAGVILAATVVLVGCVLYLARHGHEPFKRHRFHDQPDEPYSLQEIVRSVRALEARGIIQLGFLLLIATPLARVIFSMFAFVRQRDYVYVFFTMIVLAVLIYSLFSGGT